MRHSSRRARFAIVPLALGLSLVVLSGRTPPPEQSAAVVPGNDWAMIRLAECFESWRFAGILARGERVRSGMGRTLASRTPPIPPTCPPTVRGKDNPRCWLRCR